jgi:hypothetical protein
MRLAAKKAGIDVGTAYGRRDREPGFAEAMAQAKLWGQARIGAGAVDPEDAAGPMVVRRSKNNGTQLVKAAKGRWSGESEKVFLSHVAATGTVRRAAEACGFSTTALYRRRKLYPEFAEKWRAEKELGCRRVSLRLLAAAEAALDPEADAEALGLPKVSVAEAIAILKAHKFDTGGGGEVARGAIVKDEPPIEAVRDEVLRRLEAMRAHREGQPGRGEEP